MRKRSRFAVLATVASVAASFLVASPAVAAAPFDAQCHGDRVIRCVRLDVTGSGAVAIASVTDDQSDSSNYDVTVDAVQLQAWYGYWSTIREASGDSGWQVEWDRAVTSGGGCDQAYRVVAFLRWRAVGGTATGETFTSKSAVVNC
ncbi:hypothetical protein [Promicromonospora sp. NPDC057488]|uniref:hypothetical protein n=1 Tax=Promicromonospora sp. NPDC057488 TaxID=3346147 RepID=UPI003672FBB0